MDNRFKFIPIKFCWAALNPDPKGVIYFIGGAFFGTFPNIFYRYLLKSLYEEGYTIIAIPFRFTFDHWAVSIELLENLQEIKKILVNEATLRGYKSDIYKDTSKSPEEDKPSYFWLGHSLGCKYISLLEILTLDKKEFENNQQKVDRLKTLFKECKIEDQLKNIKRVLVEADLLSVSLLNQPSLFIAPVIAGIKDAIPVDILVKLLYIIDVKVRPDVDKTHDLISKSPLFNIFDIISFQQDNYARETVNFFVKVKSLKDRLLEVKPLPNRKHLDPLGYQNGDKELVKDVIYLLQNFSM